MYILTVLAWLLSTLAAPAPLAGITIIHSSDGQTVQAVIHLLNSDPRYEDFAITVTPTTGSQAIALPPECDAALLCTLHAPRRVLQTITVTLALDPLPTCGLHRAYAMIVTARVLTETTTFARTEVGGMASFECPYRLYMPT